MMRRLQEPGFSRLVPKLLPISRPKARMAYKRSRPGGALSIDVMDDSKVDESYDADAEVFEKGELAIDSEGFSMGARCAVAPRRAPRARVSRLTWVRAVTPQATPRARRSVSRSCTTTSRLAT